MKAVLSGYTLSECMDIMCEYAKTYEQTGGRNIIFCEDRLTLVAERALVRALGGTFFSKVTTFSRFLQTSERVISKQGSVMAVAAVMSRLQKEGKLKCFKFASAVKNGAGSVYETIAQLSASQVDGQMLASAASELSAGVLQDKVFDLALIADAYADFLRENGLVDEGKYLSLLPAYIRSRADLNGCNFIFLCYGSLTKQALETVKACLDVGANVVGIFCAGEEDLYTNAARSAFIRTCEEHDGEKPVYRNFGKPLLGEAEFLRRNLFCPESLSEYEKRNFSTDKVRFFEGEDKAAELFFVAANVKKLLAENPQLHYRDFAVLLSDPAAYSLPLSQVFGAYQIPYFLDVKKSLGEHPLCKFLVGLFTIVKEGFSPKSVQAVLSNVFFGEASEYRNYLLKYGAHRGGAKKPIKGEELIKKTFDPRFAAATRQRLEETQNRLLNATAKIPTSASGRAYCDAVREILRDFNADETLKRLEEGALDVSLKGYLSQISKALDGVLAEAELLTGDQKLGVLEFESILSEGLAATEISLIPLKTDAVFVGDVTDSRIEKISVLFALGMTDGVPKTADDTALVSDKEIEKLATLQTVIEPTVQQVNLRSRETAGLNLCTFTDRLFLCYSTPPGQDVTQSDVFRYAKLFTNLDGSAIVVEKALPESDVIYAASAPATALMQMLAQKRAFDDGRTHDTTLYSALYQALQKAGKNPDEFLSVQGGQVRVQNAEKLFFRTDVVSLSPTRLESYFKCPFQNFLSGGLRLKEREEATVLAVDSGNFIHTVLERVGQELKKSEPVIKSEDDARAFAKELGEKLVCDPLYKAQLDTKAGKYASDNLVLEGVEAAAAVYRQIAGSFYQVQQTEVDVKTQDFHGKIDRVDVSDGEDNKFVRIVDYKTGHIDDKPIAYYTGRHLQMQLYMSAVKGERTPAGVFYFPASLSFKSDGGVNFEMAGFLNGDEAAIRAGDKELEAGKVSDFFGAALGSNGSRMAVMDGETFSYFLDYAVLEARQGTKELKGGFIAPTPYEGACDWCKYGGICGFNKDKQKPRSEKAIKPKQIADIVKKAQEGQED